MNSSTRDDDGRRRKTAAQNSRVVVVDGRFVTMDPPRPVVAKSVATQLANDVGQRDWPMTAVSQTLAAAWQGMKLCRGVNIIGLALVLATDPVADKIIAWILLIFLITAVAGLIGASRDGEDEE